MLKVIHSKDFTPNPKIIQLDDSCNAKALREVVEMFSFSRSRFEEEANFRAKYMLNDLGIEAGYKVAGYPGCCQSVEWEFPHADVTKKVIAGATHFDTVENCPGADDNASGIAVLVCAARFLKKNRDKLKNIPHFYFFNAEEEGLLGSTKFVNKWLAQKPKGFLGPIVPEETHVMEMVGYTAENQSTPPGLPNLGNRGDFLGIVGNGIAKDVIRISGESVPDLNTKGLDIPFEMTSMMSDVLRSDHTPFWEAGFKATMWTDTSNFRNPHYHKFTDLPETLNYEFMEKVTKLFISLFI